MSVIDFPNRAQAPRLKCTQCGAETDAACQCGVAYEILAHKKEANRQANRSYRDRKRQENQSSRDITHAKKATKAAEPPPLLDFEPDENVEDPAIVLLNNITPTEASGSTDAAPKADAWLKDIEREGHEQHVRDMRISASQALSGAKDVAKRLKQSHCCHDLKDAELAATAKKAAVAWAKIAKARQIDANQMEVIEPTLDSSVEGIGQHLEAMALDADQVRAMLTHAPKLRETIQKCLHSVWERQRTEEKLDTATAAKAIKAMAGNGVSAEQSVCVAHAAAEATKH